MSTAFNSSEKIILKESVDYSENSIVSKIVTGNSAGNITLFSFDKGQSLSRHTAPFDAFVQVLEGTADIIIDDRKFSLGEGEGIIMPANIPHAVESVTRFRMMLVMIKGQES